MNENENLQIGETMKRGKVVSILTDSGAIYMRARVHSVGKSRIILQPLPGEAKSAGLKDKDSRGSK